MECGGRGWVFQEEEEASPRKDLEWPGRWGRSQWRRSTGGLGMDGKKSSLGLLEELDEEHYQGLAGSR